MKKLILICLISLTGCDAIKDCLEEKDGICGNSKPSPTPTVSVPTPTAIPTKIPPKVTPTAKPVSGNPACASSFMPSQEHLLWKPVSDTSGNAVIVFDGKYKQEFLEVKVRTLTGSFESAFWKPLELWGNPDSVGERQHWRLRQKCDKYQNQAEIIAIDSGQTCKFKLPGNPCKRSE